MNKVDWNNPSYYKKCRKKQYDIHVCMPPKETVVINKLEQSDLVKMLNGKVFFTVNELVKMKSGNDNRFNILSQAIQQGKAYMVNDNMPFVLAGTMGELWCINANKLAQEYTFLKDNQIYPINGQTLKERCGNSQYLDWTVVRSKVSNIDDYACFVPVGQKGQVQTSWGIVLNINGVGVNHGKGDFVIAQGVGGRPDFSDRHVVNGLVFAATYNNQGWTDCLNLKSNIIPLTIDSLPKILSFNRGSKDYWDSLSLEEKKREIYNPNSPYYCGKVKI